MNWSKACKLALLASFSCLLLMVFTGATYGATIHWTVTGNPTEVINTGRSEVSGSITLTVDDPALIGGGTVLTGNGLLGPDQLAITYGPNPNGPAIQIDNQFDPGSANSGIRVYSNVAAFASASTLLSLQVQNSTTLGPCAGQVTILVPGGVALHNGDMIKVEGVRLRVDILTGGNLASVNQDIWVQVQSVNDPSGNSFYPDTVRVAKTYPGMTVGTAADVATLCFLNWGKGGLGTAGAANDIYLTQSIAITEGFARAFVAKDSNALGVADPTDRVDSGGLSFAPAWLGGGNGYGGVNINGTMVKIYLSGIPNSVTSVSWPAQVFSTGNTFSWFQEIPTSESFTTGTVGVPGNGYASAVYEYFTNNQAGLSDTTLENFAFYPALHLSPTNQQDTGTVLAGATLWPVVDTAGLCDQPHFASFYAHPFSGSGNAFVSTKYGKPRFTTIYQSTSPLGIAVSGLPDATTKQLPSNFGIYETLSPCACYLLFPYVTASAFYDTGIAVANTSMDSQVFGTKGAPNQGGVIQYWLYDFIDGTLVNNSVGIWFTSAQVNQTGRTPYTTDTVSTSLTFGAPIIKAGQTQIGLVSQLLLNLPTPRTAFSGYMIAKANFQYCHGFAYLADVHFANIAQGYLAPIIPDPSVKGPYRTASAAADVSLKLLAGESLNN